MGHRRDYGVITVTYWAFTLTDGALRMLVLLHLHDRGFAPLALASLFLLYELFGVLTNLFGGWSGTRFGLKSTLVSGLALQTVALGMLCSPQAWLTVAWVMSAQALSGIAKDLTKMSAKSYIKLVIPGAGDTFVGAYVAALALKLGQPLVNAQAAAALAVQRAGARGAPTRVEIEAFLGW